MPDARLADEVPMPELATKDFVEAGFARLDAKIDVVDMKVEALDATLSGKIESLDVKLSGKIDALDATLSSKVEFLDAKVDVVDMKVEALDATLSGKIEAVDVKLSGKIESLDAKLSGKIDTKLDHLVRQFHDDLDEHRRWVAGAVVALAAMMLTGFGALSVLVITTS